MTWTTRLRSDIGGLAAIVMGEGPTVLLLHGVGLKAEAWRAQLESLPARMIAPDMPGHGASPPSARGSEMDGFLAHASCVLHGIESPVIVVGHSMGAMLALELTVQQPERVRAVVALNAIFERSPEAASAVQSRAAELDGRTVPDPGPTLTRWFGAAQTPERKACETWLNAVDPKGYQAAYTAFAHSALPSRAALAQITCPAIFMTGSAEPNSTPQMSRAMADLTPQGRAIIVQDAAHMMPMTHADAVNAMLTQLIQEVPS